MEGLACTKLFVEGLCSSTFTGLVAAATSYAFNPLGALQANTSISSYSSSGSTSSGSYLNQSFTANFGGFMPMTFNSSQQYDSDYSMTSSRYGMSFGDYTGLPTLTNTALSASAVTSNTQSDSSWLGKVWNNTKEWASYNAQYAIEYTKAAGSEISKNFVSAFNGFGEAGRALGNGTLELGKGVYDTGALLYNGAKSLVTWDASYLAGTQTYSSLGEKPYWAVAAEKKYADTGSFWLATAEGTHQGAYSLPVVGQVLRLGDNINDALKKGSWDYSNTRNMGQITAEFGIMAATEKTVTAANKKQVQQVKTDYGVAVQENSPNAIRVRNQIQQGKTVYKGGVLGNSETGASQFLSTENPLSSGYAERFGLPPQNSRFDFIITGKVRSNVPVITRSAPGIPPNPGGDIEAVIHKGNLIIDSFYMP